MLTRQKLQLEAELRNLTGSSMPGSASRDSFFTPPRYNRSVTVMVVKKVKVVICIAHRRVYTPLMHFSSLTRTAGRTAGACSLQTQAGAPAGQAAQSAVQRSPPSVTHIMGYYSFNRSWRDGRLSWPCWMTDSGRFTYKVVKKPSISLAQDKESPPARTDVLTTMLRHQ